MIIVEVCQGTGRVKFAFKECYINSAMEFAGTCVETGEEGTTITVTVNEKEDN